MRAKNRRPQATIVVRNPANVVIYSLIIDNFGARDVFHQAKWLCGHDAEQPGARCPICWVATSKPGRLLRAVP